MLDGTGHARDQAPATDGHDDCVHIGNLVEDFQAESALAHDDVFVIKGGDKDRSRLSSTFFCCFEGFVENVSDQNHFSAVVLGCF